MNAGKKDDLAAPTSSDHHRQKQQRRRRRRRQPQQQLPTKPASKTARQNSQAMAMIVDAHGTRSHYEMDSQNRKGQGVM